MGEGGEVLGRKRGASFSSNLTTIEMKRISFTMERSTNAMKPCCFAEMSIAS